MLWGAVDNTDPNNLMRRFGTCLATYSLEGKPGDATYMKLISRNDNFNDHTLGYGDTMWEDEDGHIYLYTTSNYKVAVARTATRDLGSQWEYYVADPQGNFSWTTQYPSTQDAENSTIIPLESACSMPWVFKKGDTYYMIGQSMWFGRDVLMFRSKHPYGPFVDQKTLFTLPEFLDKIGEQRYQHVYMVNIHPALLPKYGGKGMYGDHVHEAVVKAGEHESGITIHYINERYDEGNIIFQVSCRVLPSDTPHDVAEKVHALEYKYYPRVIEDVLQTVFT